MSGLEIAASIPAFVAIARKLAAGISRLSDLRHAPDVLLALNNEIADLQCVIEDLSELEQRNRETLQNTTIPSFHRAVRRSHELLLKVEKLIAFELTIYDERIGQLRVDRSAWIRTQKKIEQAQDDVRNCRIELLTAVNLLTSVTSIESHGNIRRYGVSLDTFATANAQFRENISSQIVGMESRLDEIAEIVKRAKAPNAYDLKHGLTQVHSEPNSTDSGGPISSTMPFTKPIDTTDFFPTLRLQALRRRPCNPSCHCACHKTLRIASPGFLEKLVGSLFLGYAGLPSIFRSCTVLGCRQDSSKLAKMTYRFPYWFWQRAVNIAFSYTFATGPELLLRFPCIRPARSDWFICARMGDAEGMKRLLENKQAGLHDVDATFGLTALHWAVHCHQPDASAFLIQSSADLAAEDRFGLTPRHCLLFHHSEVCQDYSLGLVSQQCQNVDITSIDDILEAPPLHIAYRKHGKSSSFRTTLEMSSLSSLEEQDAIGETLLFKAVRQDDLALVQQLFEYGACVSHQNRHGYTCIALACAIGDISIVRCLLDHGADPMLGNYWNPDSNALYHAIRCNRYTVLEYLLTHHSRKLQCDPTPQNRANLLHGAVSYADVTTLRILSRVRWMTMDVRKLVNGLNESLWTPRRIINSRRLADIVKTSEDLRAAGDLDSEQVFFAFTTLFRKMVDDHYGSLSDSNHAQVPSAPKAGHLPQDSLARNNTVDEGSLMQFDQELSGTCAHKETCQNPARSTRKVSPSHPLPLWSTTPCGQRGKIVRNTSAPLETWNPPFHMDWAAVDSLFFEGNNGLNGNENRKLFSCGATIMTHLSTWYESTVSMSTLRSFSNQGLQLSSLRREQHESSFNNV